MTKFSKILPFIIGAILIVVFLLVVIPVPVSRENSAELNTVVTRVSQGGMQDIVLSLQGATGVYYISEGIKRGFTVDSLSAKLLNTRATVLYVKPRFLSRISPQAGPMQVTEIRSGGKVIFSEFDKKSGP